MFFFLIKYNFNTLPYSTIYCDIDIYLLVIMGIHYVPIINYYRIYYYNKTKRKLKMNQYFIFWPKNIINYDRFMCPLVYL